MCNVQVCALPNMCTLRLRVARRRPARIWYGCGATPLPPLPCRASIACSAAWNEERHPLRTAYEGPLRTAYVGPLSHLSQASDLVSEDMYQIMLGHTSRCSARQAVWSCCNSQQSRQAAFELARRDRFTSGSKSSPKRSSPNSSSPDSSPPAVRDANIVRRHHCA